MKIKNRCFICESYGVKTICNPNLDETYYNSWGNICHACNSDIIRNMESPKRRAFRHQAAKLMTVNARKPIEYDEINVPDEAL